MNPLFRTLATGLTTATAAILLSIALPTAARAEKVKQVAYNPFQLVSLAEQGTFAEQDIPSYQALTPAYETGELTGLELVQAAVATNRLPQSSLSDQAYINAVDNQLAHWEIDD
ncbi:hypothetical protein Pse7367_3676 (plasmid) [Thalassoporum mexicanum PCC 7367]|uniref:hypothetical protein n=1 Tax=Thalassoporum mexicanum TaxID=3457544 RepID=UPI00029F9B59|nr:hypothetical protein [Pseudanabaena sp. PCC 7367]AFY71909.1 hypothetical protein Pse7367_3676 [Pseudanabaena sp. PCC 7367]